MREYRKTETRGEARPCRVHLLLRCSLRQSVRPRPSGSSRDQLRNPRVRTPGVPGAPAKRRWNWRARFLSGPLPPGYARIAIAPDIVRPAHGAAIVEEDGDESLPLFSP